MPDNTDNSQQASNAELGNSIVKVGEENGVPVYSSPLGAIKVQNPDLAKNLLGNSLETPETETHDADKHVPNTMEDTIFNPSLGTSQYNKNSFIKKGPNIIPNQPPHDEQNPKHKELDGKHPSLPGNEELSFKREDYADPHNRNNPNYGPTTVPSGLSNFQKINTVQETIAPEQSQNNTIQLYTDKNQVSGGDKQFENQSGINPTPEVIITPPPPIEDTETSKSENDYSKIKEGLELIGKKIAELEAKEEDTKNHTVTQMSDIRDALKSIGNRLSTLENTPQPIPPVNPPISNLGPQPQPSGEVVSLREELRTLKGQNTPEQRSAFLKEQMETLLNGRSPSKLRNEEKLQYLDMLLEQNNLSKEIQDAENLSSEKRQRKEKIIKIVAFAAGAGLALATPAVSVTAVVAVTLGGRFATPLINKLSNKIRTKANDLKYSDRNNKTLTELGEIDKKIKRNEWWANRLGELAAVVSGGTAGYGMGKLVKGLFTTINGNEATIENSTNPASNQPQVPTSGTENSTSVDLGGGQTPPETVPQSILSDGKIFDTNGLGWDTEAYGWGGPRLLLDGAGGNWGTLQGQLFAELQKEGVTRAMLTGADSGRIFASGLNQLYQGGDPIEIAQIIASQLPNI